MCSSVAVRLQLGKQPLLDERQAAKLRPRDHAAVLEYVEEHLADRISLDHLADVAGCSRFHFGRLFKASTGQSPMAWVGQRRIERRSR